MFIRAGLDQRHHVTQCIRHKMEPSQGLVASDVQTAVLVCVFATCDFSVDSLVYLGYLAVPRLPWDDPSNDESCVSSCSVK